MATKKQSRKTKGFNAQVFVAKPIDYTTDATLALFVANAPTGELGVYDATNALHTDAITSSEEFFFVMRTTEGVKRTPTYKLSEVTPRKKLYVAPVKQVSYIGWNGTSGALSNAAVANRKVYGIKVIETTEGNDPFPTWNYEYQANATDTIYEVMLALVNKINDDTAVEHKQNERLVDAKLKANSTLGNFAMTGTTPTLTFTNGSATVTLGGTTPTFDGAAGDLLSVSATATPTVAVGDIYKISAVSAGVSVTLDRPYTGATVTLTQAQAQGTRLKKVTVVTAYGIELTAINYDTHFRLAVNEELVNATITVGTAYVKGNGTYDQVLVIEKEGNIYDGFTAYNNEFTDKYQTPDSFVTVDETYDYYHFDVVKTEAGSGLQGFTERQPSGILIAVAKSAGNVDGTLNTLFGL